MTAKFWLKAQRQFTDLLYILPSFFSEGISDSRAILEESLGRLSDYNGKSFIVVISY